MDWMILVVADAFLLILATLAIAISGIGSFRRGLSGRSKDESPPVNR